jgi:cytochrome c biogenesis protein CcmG/thiol:disulfide interchange protein DsbE
VSAADRPSISSPAVAPPFPSRSTRLVQIGLGLGVALAILAGAWFVGGRSGLESVGRGGVNQRLLPKVGDVAPDFTTEDLFGNRVTLSQFRGQPVWLMFWGSWCPPCRAEFPDVQRAYQQLEPKGIRLLAVDVRESAMAGAAYAAENNATFLVLSDPDETDTGAAYPLFNVPTHIFIDANGVIRSIVLSDMSEERAMREGLAIINPAAGGKQT